MSEKMDVEGFLSDLHALCAKWNVEFYACSCCSGLNILPPGQVMDSDVALLDTVEADPFGASADEPYNGDYDKTPQHWAVGVDTRDRYR